MFVLAGAATSTAGGQRVHAADTPTLVGVIAGRVVDVNAAPVAGARVRVIRRTDSHLIGAASTAARDARDSVMAAATEADAAGQFVLRDIPVGVVQLDVRRLGYATRLVPDVVVQRGEPAQVVVVLDPAPIALGDVAVRATYFPTVASPGTPVSATQFSTQQLARTPGVQEDVARALSVVPGVGVTTEGRNDLVVRGGAPVETLFLIDGLEVPSISHFGAQASTGGGAGLVPIGLVSAASLATGGFGARYGDRASGVVDVKLREGMREQHTEQLHVSILDAGLAGEGPLGASGSYLASVRRSYLGPVFRALGANFIPDFEDLTLKAVTRPSPRDELSSFVVVGRSTVALDSTNAGERYSERYVVAPNETQYFAGATWRHSLTDARGAAAVTVGRTWQAFATEQDGALNFGEPAQILFRAHSTEAEDQVRATLVSSPRGSGARATTWEAGAVAKYADRLHYAVNLPGVLRRDAVGEPHPLAIDTTFTTFRAAAYAQVSAQIMSGIRAVLGVHVDDYAFLNETRGAPRVSLTWTPASGASAFTVAGGRYWQAPQPSWLAGDSSNLPRAPGGGVHAFRADHLVLGWRRTLRSDMQLRVEAYTKWYADYPARVFRPRAVLQPGTFDNALTDIPFGLEPLASVGVGRVRGAEMLVEKHSSALPTYGSIYGLAALSLARARFTGLDGTSRPGAYDVPMIATLLAGWHPGGASGPWDFSTRARVASGAPTTPFARTGPFYGQPDPTRYDDGLRRTRFFSVDVRAERRFTRGGTRPLVGYVEVQDVTGRDNWYAEEWDAYRAEPFHVTTLGRLPSIGLDWTL